VLQCVAACCTAQFSVVSCWSVVLQCVATCCRVLHCPISCSVVLECRVAVCCNELQRFFSIIISRQHLVSRITISCGFLSYLFIFCLFTCTCAKTNTRRHLDTYTHTHTRRERGKNAKTCTHRHIDTCAQHALELQLTATHCNKTLQQDTATGHCNTPR